MKRARFFRALAWINLAGLLLVMALFWFVGERWWPVVILLYVPRAAFALPLVIIVPALFKLRARLLWTQGVCLALVVGPLMGLHVALPHSRPAATFRLMTYNVWYGKRGTDAILAEIDRAHPDVVVLQATSHLTDEAIKNHFPNWHVEVVRDLAIASRFPIRDAYEPPLMGEVPAQYVRYGLATPIGDVDVYTLHPYSPREGLYRMRGEWVHSARKGGSTEQAIARDTTDRELQLRAAADDAARRTLPVVIAGDTNSPEFSRAFRETFRGYGDAFADAGIGYGYTFPSNRLLPWMRLDRILYGRGLRVVSVSVGGRGGSDHCPVVADLASVR